MRNIYIVGSINMDLVINTDIMPNNGETLKGHSFMSNPGGKGANQAVAVAKSKGKAIMVGCVGKEFGEELVNVLNNYNVDTTHIYKIDNVSSGVAVIIINDNDNRIILDSGANNYLTIDKIKESLKDAKEGDYLICQLETPIKDVCEGIKFAKEKGLITILNPAPAANLDKEVFKYLDYFIPNQSETKLYTNIYPDNKDNINKALIEFEKLGVKNTIITLGTKGSIAKINNELIYQEAFKVKAIDTTAAGDTFVGALVASLADNKDIKEAIKYATKASSITVTRKGAQQSIPYKEEIII